VLNAHKTQPSSNDDSPVLTPHPDTRHIYHPGSEGSARESSAPGSTLITVSVEKRGAVRHVRKNKTVPSDWILISSKSLMAQQVFFTSGIAQKPVNARTWGADPRMNTPKTQGLATKEGRISGVGFNTSRIRAGKDGKDDGLAHGLNGWEQHNV